MDDLEGSLLLELFVLSMFSHFPQALALPSHTSQAPAITAWVQCPTGLGGSLDTQSDPLDARAFQLCWLFPRWAWDRSWAGGWGRWYSSCLFKFSSRVLTRPLAGLHSLPFPNRKSAASVKVNGSLYQGGCPFSFHSHVWKFSCS